MAIPKKKKTKPEVILASSLADDMEQAGLPSNFWAIVARARYRPFDYNGKINPETGNRYPYQLSMTFELVPDPDSGHKPFSVPWTAANLDHWIPCNGTPEAPEPVDLDEVDDDDVAAGNADGYYAAKIGGSQNQLPNNSNWAFVSDRIEESGFPREEFSPDVRCFESIYAYWVRVPQPERSGLRKTDEQKKRIPDILVPTEISEPPKEMIALMKAYLSGEETTTTKPKKKGIAKPAEVDDDDEEETPAAKPKKKAAASSDDLDEVIATALVEALSTADEFTIKKKDLAGLMMGAFEGQGATKAKAVRRSNEAEFLTSREEFEFDADEGTVTLAG